MILNIFRPWAENFYMRYSRCLEILFPEICVALSLISFWVLLNHYFFKELFHDHLIKIAPSPISLPSLYPALSFFLVLNTT